MRNNELKHYGVLGMKWGKRKTKPINEYRQKAKKIAKKEEYNGNVGISKRAKWAAQSTQGKIFRSAMVSTFKTSMNNAMFGRPLLQKSDIKSIIGQTAEIYAYNEVTSRMTMKKYDDNGRRITKRKLIETEDLIEPIYSTAKLAASFGKYAAFKKLSEVQKDIDKKKANFDKWGGNILDMKYSDFGKVLYSDEKVTIFDKK